jgi:hypothetical protein
MKNLSGLSFSEKILNFIYIPKNRAYCKLDSFFFLTPKLDSFLVYWNSFLIETWNIEFHKNIMMIPYVKLWAVKFQLGTLKMQLCLWLRPCIPRSTITLPDSDSKAASNRRNINRRPIQPSGSRTGDY